MAGARPCLIVAMSTCKLCACLSLCPSIYLSVTT
jgi:hypothetical protein